ncbi:MAG: IS66 family insertion sequence element accessory protein TnpB [Rhodobacteraceae bacterium]|nr:IS66 family insertion sequence element accessory protein TnpB [Paracoccaceae bacterium]
MVHFRKGHDGLAAVVQNELGLDPHSGIIVVFRAKRGDRIKVLSPAAMLALRWRAGLSRSANAATGMSASYATRMPRLRNGL